jgi:hypothetical protein
LGGEEESGFDLRNEVYMRKEHHVWRGACTAGGEDGKLVRDAMRLRVCVCNKGWVEEEVFMPDGLVVMKLHVNCKDRWLALESRDIQFYGHRHHLGIRVHSHGTIEQKTSPDGIRVKEEKEF